MQVRLCFVPMGGGEVDHVIDVEMPQIPRSGDYLLISREGEIGNRDYVVKRTWWNLRTTQDEKTTFEGINVECEYAKGAMSSSEHLRSYEMYSGRKNKTLELDASMY